MDLLMECAAAFHHLMNYQYRFVLGRKGKKKEITLGFSETDFHHLVGLHKLKDIEVARQSRSIVFRDILNGRITYQTLLKSEFFNSIQSRIQTFPDIEKMLDQEQIIFRYNKKIYPYSAIESEFLVKIGEGIALNIAFLFLDKVNQGLYYCRSFFPMEKTDYSKGQMQYTLLKKEKYELSTGGNNILYDRFS